MQSPAALIRQVPYLGQVALMAAIYFAAARLSLVLAIPPGYATAVWPPSGIALAATLLLGWRIWPGIWLGAAVANLMVETSTLSAALIAIGNTLEAVVGATLIRRYIGDPSHFKRAENVVTFIVLCALSATIAATVALVPLTLNYSLSWAEVLRNWWTWWQGDVTGIIIVAPLILSWSTGDALAWPRQKKLELVCFGLLLLLAAAAISSDDATHFAPFSLTFVTLPFIIWAALRFGQREVTTAVAVVCGIAVWYTLERPELFASVPLNELLLMLLTFISMVVTTGLVLVTVVDERRRTSDELRKKHDQVLQYDSLTGLANRTLFHERLAQHVRGADAKWDRFAVCIVDVDRFKTVNHTFGRQAGDSLLKEITGRMAQAIGDRARLARISANGFALVIPSVQSDEEAARKVEQILHACFDPPFGVGQQELRISAKAGLALFPDDGIWDDALFVNAEAACKNAKETGDRYLFYTQRMNAAVAESLRLENKLRLALERNEFVLHYQPKKELATGRMVGVEALIRWQSPELGLIPPVQFIPLMEETGLIVQVGAWALKRAVLDHREWLSQGLAAPRIAVNVSAIQLRQREFVSMVSDTISHGGAPAAIDLEITESLLMEDIAGNIERLRAMRALGVRVAIDDFGTGHSSLAYLAKLPVDALKIDRSFIITMLQNVDTMTLVSTIISLARALKLKVVAEGVESEEQAKVLRLLRCDEMQGYLYSKPLPAAKLVELLHELPESPTPREKEVRGGRRANILVVDDDESMRELVRLHLANAGYDVRLAEDAVAAGHLVLRNPPDLIIADVEMPYMDGFQFVEALKSDPAVSAIPVIFLTVRADGESRSKAIGAAGYLTKPLVLDRLLAMVAKHVPGNRPGDQKSL
jgi:diguanylate cyclase (GGDEF)-like protein